MKVSECDHSKLTRQHQTMGKKQQVGRGCKIQNIFIREFLAEFLGELKLVGYLTSDNNPLHQEHLSWWCLALHPLLSQSCLSPARETSSPLTGGELVTDSKHKSLDPLLRWGVGVLLGVIVSGGVSGGHLNPAVSVALATTGQFPWPKV